ncbi:AbrB/MazE/SpoVT family DNA-binding domain-containing protein [Halorubrum sp. RMP-47]|uniref:AbrB/MazE/SpoVT family DNA-binding domain-containing protein n=1 Tax=Halorubrum miltondacostae TaxID=3076378 RepID=UPI0035292B1E
MTRVDSEGRILLPEGIRERLDMTPGTEVAVREEGRKVVVEPATSPDEILERMEQMIKEMSPNQKGGTPLGEKANLTAHKHKDAIQRRAESHSDE